MRQQERFWTEGCTSAGLPLTDRGFLYGEGLLETFLIQAGRPFRLAPHLRRMQSSAADLHIPLPRSGWELRVQDELQHLVESSGLTRGRGRLTLTAGDVGPGGDPATPAQGPGRLILRLGPYAPPPVAGVRGSPPSHKSLSYLVNLLCLRQARREGAQEGLLRTADGRIVSGSRSTLFLLLKRGLVTPPLASGCLPGITRAVVLDELAPLLGLRVEEEDVDLGMVNGACEAFLTNSLWGIRPVRTGAHPVPGRNGPGPVTESIIKSYASLLAVECGVE